MKKYFYILIFLIFITLISIIAYDYLFLTKLSLNGEFKISKGETIASIGKRLAEKGFVKHPLIFNSGVRIYKQEKNIKAGYYLLKGQYTIEDLINQLTKGSSKLIKITFPEGLTCFEVFDKLCKKGFGDKEVYIDIFYHPAPFLPLYFKEAETLEGFLFPETYFFREKETEKEILTQMVKLFSKKYSEIEKPTESSLTPYQSLILASLVERETNGKNEEGLIASVFLNRLKKKMRLQCDPTIIYALILDGKYDGNIRKKDISMENRFNTYYISGLPPTPIANPGFKALNAIYNNEKTNYLYFVANNSGTHVFSKTYKEHLKNVDNYQIKYWRKKRWEKKKK